MIKDLHHDHGGDIAANARGDVALSDGAARGRQRVLRRLLTNPGDYIFHPDYGAGLPRMVGELLDEPAIAGLIRQQMALEPAVAQDPEPTIAVALVPGGVQCTIIYMDADSEEPVRADFSLTV